MNAVRNLKTVFKPPIQSSNLLYRISVKFSSYLALNTSRDRVLSTFWDALSTFVTMFFISICNYLPFNKKLELHDILIIWDFDYIYFLIMHFHVYQLASSDYLFLVSRGHLCSLAHHNKSPLDPSLTVYGSSNPNIFHISLGFWSFFFQLEANYFTMLCWFLLYNNCNQS